MKILPQGRIQLATPLGLGFRGLEFRVEGLGFRVYFPDGSVMSAAGAVAAFVLLTVCATSSGT